MTRTTHTLAEERYLWLRRAAGLEDPWRSMETAPRNGSKILLAVRTGCEKDTPATGWWDVDDDFDTRERGWRSPEAGWRRDEDMCIPANQEAFVAWVPLPLVPWRREGADARASSEVEGLVAQADDLVVHDPEEPDELADPAYRRALKRLILKAAGERGDTAIKDWSDFDAETERLERDEVMEKLKAGDFDGLIDEAIFKALRGTPYQCVVNGAGKRRIVRRRPR